MTQTDENKLANFDIHGFQKDLIGWYKSEKRDLPWRLNRDPYRVWISEIMLQQTRVDTVIPYYNRFMDKFPNIQALAEADEQEVLKAWEGLGYYSRARNLQTAAREVMALHDGQMPSAPKLLGALKGIGPYTKGAVLSIAFGQAEPAVDGNVMRVMSRILEVDEDIALPKTRKTFEALVSGVISHEDPSSFNQGLMELGALICTPQSPMCLFCPVQRHCRAFHAGKQLELPIKSKAKKKKKIRYAALLITNPENKVLVEKRPQTGLLAGLWQFPMVELAVKGESLDEKAKQETGMNIEMGEKAGVLKHVFTHLIWEIDIYHARTTVNEPRTERMRFVTVEEMNAKPFPVSHQKMMPYLLEELSE